MQAINFASTSSQFCQLIIPPLMSSVPANAECIEVNTCKIRILIFHSFLLSLHLGGNGLFTQIKRILTFILLHLRQFFSVSWRHQGIQCCWQPAKHCIGLEWHRKERTRSCSREGYSREAHDWLPSSLWTIISGVADRVSTSLPANGRKICCDAFYKIAHQWPLPKVSLMC